MGKLKEIILDMGDRRKEAEDIENKAKIAGILKEEEKVEVRRKSTVKNISEVKSIEDIN